MFEDKPKTAMSTYSMGAVFLFIALSLVAMTRASSESLVAPDGNFLNSEAEGHPMLSSQLSKEGEKLLRDRIQNKFDELFQDPRIWTLKPTSEATKK